MGLTGSQAKIDSPQRVGKAFLKLETDVQLVDVEQMMIFYPGQSINLYRTDANVEHRTSNAEHRIMMSLRSAV